jgi:hypothetical protein
MRGDPLDKILQHHITVTSVFNSVEARNPRTGLKLISEILFDILNELWQLDESAAQSLWLSVRQHGAEGTSSSDSSESEMVLPDDVGELLRDTTLRARSDFPVELFDLDWDTEGNFHQQWLFTRVMSEGSLLWYGEAQPHGFLDPPPSPNETPVEKSSVISRLRPALFLRLLMEFAGVIHHDGKEEYDPVKTSQALTMFAQMSAATLPKYPYPPDLRGSHAIFDVDGPADIAIVYDARREIWPHPHDRAMSACWVVERAGDPDLPKKSGKGKEVARDADDAEMWMDDDPWNDTFEWKVVDRVKGFWPLMERTPFLRCHFT